MARRDLLSFEHGYKHGSRGLSMATEAAGASPAYREGYRCAIAERLTTRRLVQDLARHVAFCARMDPAMPVAEVLLWLRGYTGTSTDDEALAVLDALADGDEATP
jgi:hypothetical protein